MQDSQGHPATKDRTVAQLVWTPGEAEHMVEFVGRFHWTYS